jgi:anti-anti-sigma factor
MTWLARVVEDREGEIAIAGVEGEIDSSNVDEIADRVQAMLTNRSDALVVDLERTSYIDSAGINLLFALGAELEQRQQAMHLVVAPGSPIARMLSITGLDTTLPTHPTRAAAVDAVGAVG